MENSADSPDTLVGKPGTPAEVNPAPSSDPLWTVEDVAAFLKLQPETIRSMARRGELPALKIGKVWRFQKNAIHEMLINMYESLTA
jgi:excisionase family DNA binding protein